MAQQTPKDVETLTSEITELRAQLEKIGKTMQAMAAERADEMQHHVRETLNGASARTREAADAASRQIAERPLASLIGAFLVGLVLGSLFSRRS